MNMPTFLSKSRYIAGVQCRKHLWLSIHKPELCGEPDKKTQQVFDIGHMVGKYARQVFDNGTLIEEDHLHTLQAIQSTKKAAESSTPALFEAAVSYNRLMCRADILFRAGKVWDLYEVKSTTQVKDIHLHDVAFQIFCFEKAGYRLRKAMLMHVDSSYVRHGDIEPKKLFGTDDISKDVKLLTKDIEKTAQQFVNDIDSKTCLEIEPGSQCTDPYECPFYEYCKKEPEPYSIYELSRGNKVIPKLENIGITSLKDVPDDFPLNEKHKKQVTAIKTKKPVIDTAAIKAFLKTLEYPLYFFDYETIASAIPLFDGSRPYQNVPFQFSLHIQKKPNDECEHYEFLGENNQDPREPLIEQMLKLIGKKGSIVAFNATFEIQRIKELARDFPHYSKDLLPFIPRFRDLIIPFRNGDYVHRDFHGSASLKFVLPVLVPKLSYKDLEIQEGGTASLFAELWYCGKMNETEWKKTRKDLLKYCKLDTLAMVEVLKVLYLSIGK